MTDFSPQHDFSIRPRLPLALKIVAWLFIVWGILAAIEVVLSLVHGKVHVNLSVVGIFVGRGLLKVRPGWWTCALALLWFAMILIFVLLVCAAFGFGTLTLFSSEPLPDSAQTRAIGVAICGVAIGFLFWQYRVLTRPDVRRLFLLSQAQERWDDVGGEA
jgi:hypothetical protein